MRVWKVPSVTEFLDTSAVPTSRVQTGDAWGADLAANWGSNLSYLNSMNTLNSGQTFTTVLSPFLSFFSDFGISNIPGP